MKNAFKKMGVMVDCSRNAVPTVQTLKLFIDKISLMGYNRLELYTEDTYEIKSRPYFGYLRGRYSGEELKSIDNYAASRGIELVPCIQVLAHLNQIFRWQDFRNLCDCNDILLVDEPKTYHLIDDMFASLAENFTSRDVNIGCDEAFMVGLGKYMELHGYQNRFDIINRHVGKVVEIAKKYGFRCAMWSDMYFRLAYGSGDYTITDKPLSSDILEKVPKELTLIYWDYYSTDSERYRKIFAAHKKFGNPIEFAGGAWKWQGFAPDNLFSMGTASAAIPEARRAGIDTVMITAWGDNGAETSLFSILPSLFYFSRLCHSQSVDDEALEEDFKQIAGIGFKAFMDVDLLKGKVRKADTRNGSNEKVLLYLDYFGGIFDNWVGDKAAYYKDVADHLAKGNYGEFSYLFETLQMLANLLAKKADIGVRTRALYRKKDKAGLRVLADEYLEIIKRISDFHKRFQSQWFKENKPYGFDVQDMRLGGLLLRTKTCRNRLIKYCGGKLSDIPELDEDILPYGPENPDAPLAHNSHAYTVTVNII